MCLVPTATKRTSIASLLQICSAGQGRGHFSWNGDPSKQNACAVVGRFRLVETQFSGFELILPRTLIGRFPAASFKAFNNAVTRHEDGSGFTMAIELGAPSAIVGSSFTSVFARVVGNDPSQRFQLLDPTKHVYTTSEYSACPTIRQYGNYFYVFTLFITPVRFCELVSR